MTDLSPSWLRWARTIQALAQSGLTYSTNPYDQQRYQQLQQLAAEIVATATDMPTSEVQGLFADQVGYATPKVDVRGAIVQDGQILLVQESSDQCWCLPGGWADVGSSPAEMVIREVWEESGLTVIPTKLIGVFDANRSGRPLALFHAYKLIFLCRATGGSLRPSDETLAAAYFPWDALPPLSEQRTHHRHLQEIQQHLRDPARLTVFE